MRNSYRVFVFILAVLVTLLVIPLWFEKVFDAQSIGQRVESLLVPTATAAVIVPAAVRDATTSMPQPQFDAARLLMMGTVLFGLAAVVRKSI